MFYVYIIQSINFGRYYIGYSSNLEKRLNEHNSGIVKSTKHYVPYKLIFKELHETRKSAMKREKEIKKMKGGLKFEELVG